MEEHPTPVLIGLLVVSVGAHFVAWLVLGLLPPLSELFHEDLATLEVVEPALDPPPEEAPTAPEPAAEPEPIVRRRVVPRPVEEPPPEQAPPPAAEETVEDFTGTTLTNDDGEGWQTNVGNGSEIQAPLGRPNAAVTGRNRSGQVGGTPGGTGDNLVAAADLSRQPQFPGDRLQSILQRNFPQRLRELGIEGDAVVRIHVYPDGRVQPLSVVRETNEGFGEACRRTLREGGRWDPPLDRAGHEVATITTFRCTFSFSN
jgi:TonB family protein